eukprot:TRINITY_DN1266_c0_g1_i2.p1 TRINITY_DN1266_c0_g1~~TRINITY_DN1266_c0_g1_i2.p1  ORF type:complete len:153 (-),score=1.89 TRINITY_DN1266_c0_g1_i2:111-545(-)
MGLYIAISFLISAVRSNYKRLGTPFQFHTPLLRVGFPFLLLWVLRIRYALGDSDYYYRALVHVQKPEGWFQLAAGDDFREELNSAASLGRRTIDRRCPPPRYGRSVAPSPTPIPTPDRRFFTSDPSGNSDTASHFPVTRAQVTK